MVVLGRQATGGVHGENSCQPAAAEPADALSAEFADAQMSDTSELLLEGIVSRHVESIEFRIAEFKLSVLIYIGLETCSGDMRESFFVGTLLS